jgi:hypothetical protein
VNSSIRTTDAMLSISEIRPWTDALTVRVIISDEVEKYQGTFAVSLRRPTVAAAIDRGSMTRNTGISSV